MHLPVSLIRDSPTAMGLIPGVLPSLSLFSATNIPSAKNLEPMEVLCLKQEGLQCP